MPKSRTIVITVAVVVVAALIAFLAFALTPKADSEAASTMNPTVTATTTAPASETAEGTATGSPTVAPTPQTTVSAAPTSPDATSDNTASAEVVDDRPRDIYGNVVDDGGEDGFGDGWDDIGDGESSKFTAVATAAVSAYAILVEGETVEERAARLAPYFAPDSPHLTEEPLMANPQNFNDISASLTITGPVVAATLPSTDTTNVYEVVVPYTAEYLVLEVRKQVMGIGVYTVTMSKDFDGKILTLSEPDDLD